MTNKKHYLWLSLPLLAVLTAASGVSRPPDKHAIRCFRFTMQAPSYGSTGKLDSTSTISMWYYTCEEWRVIESFDYSPYMDKDTKGGFHLRKNHRYLAFQKDSLYCYQYDADSAGYAKRLRVDSIKAGLPGGEGRRPGGKDRGPNASLESLIANGRLKQVYTKKEDNSDIWIEAYTDTRDSAVRNDTILLYFSSHFKPIPKDLHLSLSKGLDSLRHAVMVKMTKATTFKSAGRSMEGRAEMSLELSEPDQFNRDSAYSYFVRYWRDCRCDHP